MARRSFAAKPESTIEFSNIAAWVAIGTTLGWLSTRLRRSEDRIVFIETMVVGIFGSFIGGEFVAAMFRTGPAEAALSFGTVALAIACSVAGLAALALMRRAVGPLRPGRPKPRR
jgi:uncharacterized membrane protein YeaQ/YmgE (transglycosylase-associated protein family)